MFSNIKAHQTHTNEELIAMLKTIYDKNGNFEYLKEMKHFMKWAKKNEPFFLWFLESIKEYVVYYTKNHKDAHDYDKLSAAIYSFPIGIYFDIKAPSSTAHLRRMREIIEDIKPIEKK